MEKTKPCALCRFVRILAIVALTLTISFYFYNKSRMKAIVEKAQTVMEATVDADLN